MIELVVLGLVGLVAAAVLWERERKRKAREHAWLIEALRRSLNRVEDE